MDPWKIFVLGYPGDLGGACTELWQTLRLWARREIFVTLIPTWTADIRWREKTEQLGHETVEIQPGRWQDLELNGATVVSFCSAPFLKHAIELREHGARLVWANCMTWLFPAEIKLADQFGPFHAYLFQSEFQRSMLEQQLQSLCGYNRERHGHLIRGAFDPTEWEFRPRAHVAGEPFQIGRMARADRDKWSTNTWKIYERIQYNERRALVMGVTPAIEQKIGAAPAWADTLKPRAIPVRDYLAQLHCLLPVNGGAKENWPQAGLEAMAAGVPIVTQNDWGWREQIIHGETGFLGSTDAELAHYAAVLAYDEPLRQRIIRNARDRLEAELANPDVILDAWERLFQRVDDNIRYPNSQMEPAQ